MFKPALPPRLTARQTAALVAISAGAGSFHRTVGEALERLGLVVPFPSALTGHNAKLAHHWALTPRGSLAATALTRKAA